MPFSAFEAKGNTAKPSLVYCDDDRRAKRVAAELIRDVGFDPGDGAGQVNGLEAVVDKHEGIVD